MTFPANRRSKLVLAVEDDRVLRVLSAELLLESGFVVAEAADGEEALQLLGRRVGEFGGLMTDIQMPGEYSGTDLAITVAKQWPSVSIMATSGSLDGRPVGLPKAAKFVRKPWNAQVIVDFAHRAVIAN